MKPNLSFFIAIWLCAATLPAPAQNFSITPAQVEISVAPAFNHTPVKVSVITNVGGLNLANLSVTSDSAWVSPSVDAAAAKIVLTFTTSNLVNALYTATISAALNGQTNSFFVKASVSQLNIFKLKDDQLRSRMYGIQLNGSALGSVVAFDPITTNYLGNVTVGKRPTDLAESADGTELFVINSVDETVSVVDLATLTVKETLLLPTFDNWGVNETTANIAVGPSNILYYTDGAWAPALRVLNRSTLQVQQTVFTQGSTGDGLGDIGVTSDKTVLFGWMQYGWSAGSANSYVTRYTIAPNGLLTYTDSGASQYNSAFARDPLETPVLVASDNQTVFIKGFAVGANSASNIKYTFPTPVYAITPGGEVAATATALYQTATAFKLADLPQSATVQAISSDYSRLVYFDATTKALKILRLLDLVGPGILNQEVLPADGSITLAPARLEWGPLPGVDRYHVYLGTSEAAVASATTNSPLFVGSVTQPFFQLTGSLTPGVTYFWRVDALTQFDVTKGDVKEFTVSLISCTPNQIDVATVAGHRDFKTTLNLQSAAPGLAWQAGASQPWVSFPQATGVTPAALQVVLDASQLSNGIHQASITISNGNAALFTIPVKLRVDALNLTVMKSTPGSVFSYAISEDTATTPTRAYLLEINTVTESIQRVVPVGSSATDLAIHPGDNRVYVPNWLTGSLLAIDLNSFTQVRAYPFAPFGGMGYSENDIYRVSAAGPGRLVWEEQDQWIDINLFNTVAGTNLASAFVREGGGECSPNRRYYYHGENNSSGAALLKFDLLGDQFTSLASVRVATYSYYGSRVVVVSDDGNRVFWNGGIFDANLNVVWTVADQIYAASADGRFAFADTEVFDTVNQSIVTNLAPASTVKTFNSVTSKLVYRGANGIAFYRLNNQEVVTPADGAIIPTPSSLSWSGLPIPTTYRLYLGTSSNAVAIAATNSPLYLGAVTTNNIALNPLAPGIYFWRCDAVTAYGTVQGTVHSFIVSIVSPSLQQISQFTLLNRPVTVSLTLSSPAPGATWQMTPGASWISLSQSNGVTPATILITLTPSNTAPLLQSGSLTVSGAGGSLFTIPVQLTVESLSLTILKSDPASAKVYAISENTAVAPTKAYLLEINSATEAIERMIAVGSSVTDLAIHNGDNRLYIPNWQTGLLRAIDKNTFQQVQTYNFAPSTAGGGDAYRVSAGAPGRIVVEEEDQWIDASLFNTVSGTKLTSAFVREGGGGFGGNGRYYYHGDNNSSGAEIHKYDVLGDQFSELAHIRVASVSYYGSRTVVVSEDGSRVFWNGSMFDANLVEQWTIADEIFSTSADGRYAFSSTKIYDTVQRTAVLGMPATTTVSAFNSTTRKLVTQAGATLGYYTITNPIALPTPVLNATFTNYNSIGLAWTDPALETAFTLQARLVGATNWTDLATLGQNVTQYTTSGLSPETSYEFRIKADTASASSAWSSILMVQTLAIPPTTPVLNTPIATFTSVTLSWSDPSYETAIILERSATNASTWMVLATLPANTTGYTDTNVATLVTYYYRVKGTNSAGDSAYSTIRNITVPQPQPPVAPTGLVAKPLSSSTVLITWNDVASETGYQLQRRTENPNSWITIALLSTNTTSYTNANLATGTQYWYRVLAYNAYGNSPYSNEDDAVPANIVNLIADDFDPNFDPGLWINITGGMATNGGPGFRGSKALYFSAGGTRNATTIPVDVSAGGTIEFFLRAGNETADGNLFWNNSESGETVALEYSKDNGTTWTTLQSLNTVYPSLSAWNSFSIAIPSAAFSSSTQFRWRQLANSGVAFDCWALDDVAISGAAPQPPDPVPFVISSTSSASSIAVFWVGSTRAASYVVERKSGLQVWTAIATVPVFVTYFTDSGLAPETPYSYRIRAINAGGSAAYSPVTSAFTWSQMQQWIADNYGSPTALSPAAMVTPGTDGCLPLLRYAFNLSAAEPIHPLQPDQASGAPRGWLDPTRNRLCIEFVRRKSATNPGIAYAVQYADNMSVWTTTGTQVTVTPIDETWERVTFEDSLPASSSTVRFCRVTVTPLP